MLEPRTGKRRHARRQHDAFQIRQKSEGASCDYLNRIGTNKLFDYIAFLEDIGAYRPHGQAVDFRRNNHPRRFSLAGFNTDKRLVHDDVSPLHSVIVDVAFRS